MKDNLYQLAGTVSVPAERRAAFIQDVLAVLYRGGIRKTEEIVLDGKTLTVVSRALPDENGIVSFDYSIFEKQKRDIGTFDTKTCTLDVSDRGYMEYGVVVNLLMVLQQFYSAEPCCLTREGKPAEVSAYLATLETLLGKRLTPEPPIAHIPLYIPMRRAAEDEFLEMWDGENLKLSGQLLVQLELWKDELDGMNTPPDFNMEQELGSILYEMEHIWDCRYADKSFVEDFLAHRENTDYKKLLAVLRGYLDKGAKTFPELTKAQAKDWVLRRCQREWEVPLMSAYVSLMTNHTQRQRVLGV